MFSDSYHGVLKKCIIIRTLLKEQLGAFTFLINRDALRTLMMPNIGVVSHLELMKLLGVIDITFELVRSPSIHELWFNPDSCHI